MMMLITLSFKVQRPLLTVLSITKLSRMTTFVFCSLSSFLLQLYLLIVDLRWSRDRTKGTVFLPWNSSSLAWMSESRKKRETEVQNTLFVHTLCKTVKEDHDIYIYKKSKHTSSHQPKATGMQQTWRKFWCRIRSIAKKIRPLMTMFRLSVLISRYYVHQNESKRWRCSHETRLLIFLEGSEHKFSRTLSLSFLVLFYCNVKRHGLWEFFKNQYPSMKDCRNWLTAES